jgi:hypothetical protein
VEFCQSEGLLPPCFAITSSSSFADDNGIRFVVELDFTGLVGRQVFGDNPQATGFGGKSARETDTHDDSYQDNLAH